MNSPGTLTWYDRISHQHHLKSYAYGAFAPLWSEVNQIPPFQFIRTGTPSAINSAKLVRVETGVESTQLYSTLVELGFRQESGSGYGVAIWPAKAKIPHALFEEGKYYLKLSDGTNTYYSEVFSMCLDVSGLLKVSYCHGENMTLPTGQIYYDQGYENYLYLKTEIGKPEFQYEEQVAKRDGYNLPIQQISWKVHRFEVIGPEHLADVMRLIRLHDFVTVEHRGRTFEVDEFSMDSPRWLEQGDLAAMDCEFKTDTVVVVNGRGVTGALSCDVTPGGCFDIDFTAVAYVLEGGAEHAGGYYVSQATGGNVNFEADDYVLVEDSGDGTVDLWQWNGATYDLIGTTPGQYVYNANDDDYWYNNDTGTLLTTVLTERIANAVYGTAVPITSIEIYLRIGGEEILVAVGEGINFPGGLEFPITSTADAVKVKGANGVCGAYYESDWLEFDPVNLIACSGNYDDDAAAIIGGITADDYYCLTLPNSYGLPQGTVKRLAGGTNYDDDTAAAIAHTPDEGLYDLSGSNPYGLPEGITKVLNPETTYADDAAAAAGGIAIGGVYAVSAGGPYGVADGIAKKRIA